MLADTESESKTSTSSNRDPDDSGTELEKEFSDFESDVTEGNPRKPDFNDFRQRPNRDDSFKFSDDHDDAFDNFGFLNKYMDAPKGGGQAKQNKQPKGQATKQNQPQRFKA